MLLKLELQLAGRYLRTKKKEGLISIVAFLSVVGIALGVATIIIVMSVFNGFRADLMSRILGVNSHISIYANERNFNDYQKATEYLLKNPEIVSVTPSIEGVGILNNTQYQNASEGVKIHGVKFSDFASNKLLKNENFLGEAVSNPDGIILGYKLARQVGAGLGDEVSLVTPQASSTVLGSIPKKKTFKVIGIFDVGMHEYDRFFAYIPLETAQLMYNYRDSVESLGVMVKDIPNAPKIAEQLQKEVGREFNVIDWQRQNAGFFGAVQVERNVMFIILILIVLVASFNIVSSMVMLVRDKARAIAILRTMGISKGSIMRVFMLVGSFNGFVGTFVGVALGLLFCENIETIRGWVEAATGANVFNPEVYFLAQLPAEVHYDEVIKVVAITLLITLTAIILPARRAAKIDPAEVLRYE